MSEATVSTTNPLAALDGIPGLRQLLMLVGLALSIAIGVTGAFWFAEPNYSLLYSNVSDREAGEIIDILRGSEIPHQIDRKSGAILVAEDSIQEARLKLASQGLPRGASFGLEIIEGESGFSTSQFMENARYHHAIETELARTIGNLRSVQYARVHLADTKSSVFVRKKQKSSASVFLYLFAGRTLDKSQVMSVVHLVASSIPNLESGNVTVVDQNGRLLSSPSDDSEFMRSSQQLEQVRQIEKTYVNRIEDLLAPMFGMNRVRATVTAQVDFTKREETKEQFDRDNASVRSEQVAENRQMGPSATGGIPGALSNQPPVDVPVQAAAGATDQTAVETAKPLNESIKRIRNFELDRTLSHTQQSTGGISRLSVAVLVDDKRVFDDKGKMTSEPLTTDELDNIERLVKDAVGYDADRGDSISISNVAFFDEPVPEPVEEAGFLAGIGIRGLLKQIFGAALVLVIGFGVVRPFLRSLSSSFSGSGAVAPRQVGTAGGGALPGASPAAAGPAVEAPPQAANLSYDEKMSVARQAADRDPERVAQIVRSWVQSDG